MPREQISKYNKKDNIKSSKKKEDLMRKIKKSVSSDSSNSDSNSESNDDESCSTNHDIDNEKFNVHEYRNLLCDLFPSKHMSNKVKSGKELKKKIEEDLKNKGSSKNKEVTKNRVPYKKNVVLSSSSSEDDTVEDDDSESEYENKHKKKGKVNITFTIGSNSKYKNCDDYESDYEDCSYNDSSSEWSDTTEDEDEPIEPEEEIKKKEEESTEEGKKTPIEENDEEILIKLKEIYEQNKNNKTITECIETCEKKIKDKKLKMDNLEIKYKERNGRIFNRLIKDKNSLNDSKFFKLLDTENQKKIIKEIREINKISRIEKPYRITLLETEMPVLFKSIAMKKINLLRYIDPGNTEYYKLKNWVDTFMRIPFSTFNSLPISIIDGVDKCHDFMENAQKTLNDAVYGLNDAKMQIMQMLGQLITNPKAIGSAIAIHGPPGTGKTSLIKEGISKILNRPFAFIALGGATDSSFLEGHSYTYEGSTWGKIIQILIDSKCMNPVIYFDELDKISETPKGDEIAGILTHLTDTSQNNQFHDKYFSEVDFDLSKCLFIFSYNDETKVNPILRDRMYKIQTKGYDKKQKMVITNNYLLPKIRDQIKFNSDEIIITDEAITYIIENNCNNEDGVRNLKRCLEIIYTKLNLYRLMKPGTNLFEQDMTLKVEFPFNVTKNVVDKLIKLKDENQYMKYLYV
jgi:ATP-dependent Lon protease